MVLPTPKRRARPIGQPAWRALRVRVPAARAVLPDVTSPNVSTPNERPCVMGRFPESPTDLRQRVQPAAALALDRGCLRPALWRWTPPPPRPCSRSRRQVPSSSTASGGPSLARRAPSAVRSHRPRWPSAEQGTAPAALLGPGPALRALALQPHPRFYATSPRRRRDRLSATSGLGAQRHVGARVLRRCHRGGSADSPLVAEHRLSGACGGRWWRRHIATWCALGARAARAAGISPQGPRCGARPRASRTAGPQPDP